MAKPMSAKVRRLCQHYADTYSVPKDRFIGCATKADARAAVEKWWEYEAQQRREAKAT